MKNEVLDILILGLLVVLFTSIYRKRATARLRFWVIAWILVLLHFAALLVPAASVRGQELVDSLSISALLLSGLCFLFSASVIFKSLEGRALAAFGIGVPALFYTNYLIFDGPRQWPLYAAATAVAVAGMVLAWRLCRGRSRVWAASPWPLPGADSGPSSPSPTSSRITAFWPCCLKFFSPSPPSTGSTSGGLRPAS